MTNEIGRVYDKKMAETLRQIHEEGSLGVKPIEEAEPLETKPKPKPKSKGTVAEYHEEHSDPVGN